MLNRRHTLALFALLLVSACYGSHATEGETRFDGGARRDAGVLMPPPPPPMDSGVLRDSGPAPDAGLGTDGGQGLDAGVRSRCEPEDVTPLYCPDVDCDTNFYAWDGARCADVGCQCEGQDCGRWTTRDACEEAHAGCDALTCRDSGGEWRWWDDLCGHYECGVRPEESCINPAPGCDCGPNRAFEPGLGCVAANCPMIEPPPDELLCVITGGSWLPICCHSECGRACPDPCGAPACDCGEDSIFDPVRGCMQATRCLEPRLGETCRGRDRCADGTICCQDCGGAGCFGEPTCREPVCDPNGVLDECGNNPLAP